MISFILKRSHHLLQSDTSSLNNWAIAQLQYCSYYDKFICQRYFKHVLLQFKNSPFVRELNKITVIT